MLAYFSGSTVSSAPVLACSSFSIAVANSYLCSFWSYSNTTLNSSVVSTPACFSGSTAASAPVFACSYFSSAVVNSYLRVSRLSETEVISSVFFCILFNKSATFVAIASFTFLMSLLTFMKPPLVFCLSWSTPSVVFKESLVIGFIGLPGGESCCCWCTIFAWRVPIIFLTFFWDEANSFFKESSSYFVAVASSFAPSASSFAASASY